MAILQFIYNCDVPKEVVIGRRLRLPHPYGIVIARNTVIGNDFTCFHQVTIGNNESAPTSVKIGNNVYIGAGAKIIGVENIGNNVKVGANAVVLHDIEDFKTAVGIYK